MAKIATPKAPKAPAAPARPVVATAPTAPTKTSKAPAKPPAAPAAPARPGKALAPSAVQAPKPTAAPVPTVTPDILAKMAEMAKQIEGLQAQLAKAKGKGTNSRSLSDILDKAPALPSGDWRLPFVGHAVHLYAFDLKKDGSIQVLDGAPVRGMFAIPRDNDLGGKGARNRAEGLIAFHWQIGEDGDFIGAPAYLQESELGTLWVRDAEGNGEEPINVRETGLAE